MLKSLFKKLILDDFQMPNKNESLGCVLRKKHPFYSSMHIVILFCLNYYSFLNEKKATFVSIFIQNPDKELSFNS